MTRSHLFPDAQDRLSGGGHRQLTPEMEAIRELYRNAELCDVSFASAAFIAHEALLSREKYPLGVFIQGRHMMLSDDWRWEFANTQMKYWPDRDLHDICRGDSLRVWRERSKIVVPETIVHELQFNAIFLNTHPKSPKAWRYRRWLLDRFISGVAPANCCEKQISQYDEQGLFQIDELHDFPNVPLKPILSYVDERAFLTDQLRKRALHYFAAAHCRYLLMDIVDPVLDLASEEVPQLADLWVDWLQRLAFSEPSNQYLTLLFFWGCVELIQPARRGIEMAEHYIKSLKSWIPEINEAQWALLNNVKECKSFCDEV